MIYNKMDPSYIKNDNNYNYILDIFIKMIDEEQVKELLNKGIIKKISAEMIKIPKNSDKDRSNIMKIDNNLDFVEVNNHLWYLYILLTKKKFLNTYNIIINALDSEIELEKAKYFMLSNYHDELETGKRFCKGKQKKIVLPRNLKFIYKIPYNRS
ncbi:hypothetical protein MYSEV_009 [Mythimna separata entomopoxvirus 'L']|uniref:Uncharacterized protein n=1 Tax=Mythimna separata entomopoxvirus 'L' TaxID=1293572 RepID=A0A916KPZ4_9POXV|nr:hypothetical protein MYSEV_009 [Mythimna separata entomopoxvirus 'L']CCU56207.1 hypothetical protein MYSEV_009 [Mythimna separata entomopoxvirus 'L']